MIYIGIDPGKSGGLVALDGTKVIAESMPDTERDVWNWFAQWRKIETYAVIEQVHSMPREGVTSAFSFGRNYGMLRMALIAAQIPFEEVQPRKWQALYGLLSKKDESKTDKKNRHKAVAQQRFPKIKVTHALADSLLIALYLKRQDSPLSNKPVTLSGKAVSNGRSSVSR